VAAWVPGPVLKKINLMNLLGYKPWTIQSVASLHINAKGIFLRIINFKLVLACSLIKVNLSLCIIKHALKTYEYGGVEIELYAS
jgi:hypothetical protein